MTNLIEGINPFAISCITWRKACRGGKHPLWYKHSRKKHPILWRFGFIYLEKENGQCFSMTR